jgi:glutathione S-transferase
MIKVYAHGISRSLRVLWALEELKAPYERIDLKWPPRLEHPEFLKISPSGALPAIEDGDVRLCESLVICEYLGRKFGGDLVVEPGEPDYWAYRELCDYGESTLMPPMAWYRRFGGYADAALNDAREALVARLPVLEQALADGREFLVAGRLTVADLSVGYTVGHIRRMGLAELLPAIVQAYDARLRVRPGYRRAHDAILQR